MKVFSLSVVLAPPGQPSTILSQAQDLSSYSFYQKGSVGEFMTFMTKTVVERTPQGQRQSVQENNYTAHVYNRRGAERLAEYPVRPAFSLLSKVIEEFTTTVPQSSYEPTPPSSPNSISFPIITTYLQKYQDPRNADTIMKVQAELDETKIVLHKTIESVGAVGSTADHDPPVKTAEKVDCLGNNDCRVYCLSITLLGNIIARHSYPTRPIYAQNNKPVFKDL